MTTKSAEKSSLHQKAAQKTGLPVPVVLDWIGNYKKKVTGRRYTRIKSKVYEKGMSSFNLFVSENKEKFSSIKDWASQWSQISPPKKAEYQEKARNITKKVDKRLEKKFLLTKLNNTLAQLAEMNVSLSCNGIDKEENSQVTLGYGIAHKFFTESDVILQRMFLYCTSEEEVPGTFKEHNMGKKLQNLRKEVAHHLNQLYGKALGKPMVHFPYKKYNDGVIQVKGLPEEILPLRLPSCYGEHKLKIILSCKEITVTEVSSSEVGENSVMVNKENEHERHDRSGEQEESSSAAVSMMTPSTSQFEEIEEKTKKSFISMTTPSSSDLEEKAKELVMTILKGKFDWGSHHLDIISGKDEAQSVEKCVENLCAPSHEAQSVEKCVENLCAPSHDQSQQAKTQKKKKKRACSNNGTSKIQKKTADPEKLYYVEDITEKQVIKGEMKLKVKWVGFPKPTWEPESSFPEEIRKHFGF